LWFIYRLREEGSRIQVVGENLGLNGLVTAVDTRQDLGKRGKIQAVQAEISVARLLQVVSHVDLLEV